MAPAQLPCKVALVHLDEQTVPSWVPETLRQEGIELAIRDCASAAELADCAGDAEVVWLFGGGRILIGNLDAVPRCRAILRTGSGTDNVPVEEATRRGIVVANTPQAFSDGVSDHAIALLFAVVRRIVTLDQRLREGHWDQMQGSPLTSIRGRTLGLVGFGHVPRQLVEKLSGFALRVLVHDPFVDDATIRAGRRAGNPGNPACGSRFSFAALSLDERHAAPDRPGPVAEDETHGNPHQHVARARRR